MLDGIGSSESSLERSQSRKGEILIKAVELSSDRTDESFWFDRRSNEREHIGLRVLCVSDVHNRIERSAGPVVLNDIRDNAHDSQPPAGILPGRRQTDTLADGGRARPVSTRKLLVHNRHGRVRRSVRVIEFAPCDNGDVKRSKVRGTDHEFSDRRAIGRISRTVTIQRVVHLWRELRRGRRAERH